MENRTGKGKRVLKNESGKETSEKQRQHNTKELNHELANSYSDLNLLSRGELEVLKKEKCKAEQTG